MAKNLTRPAALQAALERKILQCFLHYRRDEGRLSFKSVLDGFFKSSPDFRAEFLPFLEKVAAPDSPYRTEAHLASIALKEEEPSGTLFSLSDKVQILAYRYLLKIYQQHPQALSFFLNHPLVKTVSDYQYYFKIEENNWSGTGIMNEHGEWVLAPIYEGGSCTFLDGMASLLIAMSVYGITAPKGSLGFIHFGNWIDTKGVFLLDSLVIDPSFFHYGVASYSYHSARKYVNKQGEPVVMDGDVRRFSNGYSAVRKETHTLVKNENDEVIAELDFSSRVFFWPQDQLLTYETPINMSNYYYGYLDLNGNILTEPTFHTYMDASPRRFHGRDIITLPKEKRAARRFGLYNKSFELLLPHEYTYLRVLNDKYVLGKKEGEWYLFDHNGQRLDQEIPETFRAGPTNYVGDIALVSMNGKKVMVDIEGKEIASFAPYTVVNFRHGKIIVSQGAQFGMLDTDGVEVLPFEYQEIRLTKDQVALVKVNDQYMSIDLTTGKKSVFPSQYTTVKLTSNPNIYKVTLNDKVGILDITGKVMIPVLYRNVDYQWPLR